MDFDIVRSFVDAFRSALGTSAVMFALAGVGLNVMFGFTGLLNFGHVAHFVSVSNGANRALVVVEYCEVNFGFLSQYRTLPATGSKGADGLWLYHDYCVGRR